MQESTGGVLDIFGYIELIEECLKVADTNESCCIDGISKANVALQQIKEDPDIQCIVLMKRAELLYTAVRVCVCVYVCARVCICLCICVPRAHLLALE